MPYSISIIVPCRNEGPLLRQTLVSFQEARTELSFEIIVINDGSTDGCCDFLKDKKWRVIFLPAFGLGVANARNYGASVAKGDFFCFCDAHLSVEDYWLDKLARPLIAQEADLACPGFASVDKPQVIGYGVTWDDKLNWKWLYEAPITVKYIPFAPGGCLMVRRDVFTDLGGFEKGFRVFGYDDQEFSLKAWLFGYRVAVAPQVKVLHVFRERHPYPVSWPDLTHNLLRLAFLHFNQQRFGKVIEAVKIHQDFGHVMAELIFSNAWEKRQAYLAQRRYDDNWFMQRFGINF
jgi:glycosyltransferase involved in cell wall biosynthesis